MGRKEKISNERKEFIQQFLSQNNIRSAQDIEIALRDMMKETLQTMKKFLIGFIKNLLLKAFM